MGKTIRREVVEKPYKTRKPARQKSVKFEDFDYSHPIRIKRKK
jgi:hypothetical protein